MKKLLVGCGGCVIVLPNVTMVSIFFGFVIIIIDKAKKPIIRISRIGPPIIYDIIINIVDINKITKVLQLNDSAIRSIFVNDSILGQFLLYNIVSNNNNPNVAMTIKILNIFISS